MNIKVTQRLEVADGLHEGVIVDVEYRDEPYEYTDLVIELAISGQMLHLKAGYPTVISPSSKLGKLLQKFGAVLEVGKDLDPNKILVSKKCSFQTISEETKNGIFARILTESVKPR